MKDGLRKILSDFQKKSFWSEFQFRGLQNSSFSGFKTTWLIVILNVQGRASITGHISSGFVENELFSLERQSVLFVSLDGSFGFLRPLTEKVLYRFCCSFSLFIVR